MRTPAWQAVHDNAVFDTTADDLARRLQTGQKLLARAQVQEAAVAAQLRTPPHRHGHGRTPVHVNLVPSCSPAAKDVSRLEQLSARLRGLELALQEEQQQSRRLIAQISRGQAGADQNQQSTPWEQGRVDASPAAGARQRLERVCPTAAGDRAQKPRSGFSLRGFQEKIRRLEEENRALRNALGLKQQLAATENGVEFVPG
ncbi:hypothetical protein N2152v2_001967 [Parachlorella kessleri]